MDSFDGIRHAPRRESVHSASPHQGQQNSVPRRARALPVELPSVVSPQQTAVPTASTVIAHGTPIGTLADRNAKTAGDAKLARLESELKKAHEEIAELKMLVALYEEKISRDRFES